MKVLLFVALMAYVSQARADCSCTAQRSADTSKKSYSTTKSILKSGDIPNSADDWLAHWFPDAVDAYSLENFLEAVTMFDWWGSDVDTWAEKSAGVWYPVFKDPDVETTKMHITYFFANVEHETDKLKARHEYAEGRSHHHYSGDPDPQKDDTCQTCCYEDDDPNQSCTSNKCKDKKCYHGRGALQLTHNYNYKKFSVWYYGEECCLVEKPQRLLDDKLEYISALWFYGNESSYLHDKKDFAKVVDGINGDLECMREKDGNWVKSTTGEVRCKNKKYGNTNGAKCRFEVFNEYKTDLDYTPKSTQHDCTQIKKYGVMQKCEGTIRCDAGTCTLEQREAAPDEDCLACTCSNCPQWVKDADKLCDDYCTDVKHEDSCPH